MRAFLLVVALTVPSLAQAEIEFEGLPLVKIELGDAKATTTAVPPEKAGEYRVVITREGNQYFWKSRKNLPLVKTESGGYVTYTATTGAGYVRVLAPFMREMLKQLPREEREREYVYMEHLTITLGSVTYYGK
ncbi:MAG: hypothetical protein ACREBU_14635 [Nitrososphaera sp.]